MKPEHERAIAGLRAEWLADVIFCVRDGGEWRHTYRRGSIYRQQAVERARQAIARIRALDAALAEIEQAQSDAVAYAYLWAQDQPVSKDVSDRVAGYARDLGERAGREPGR